jgi:hypothetical protein
MPVDTHRAAGGLRRRIAHTRKRRRVTLAVAASVAAAVVATAVGGWLGVDKADDPAQNPDSSEAVAREFLDAYGSFDADRALSYLTADAIRATRRPGSAFVAPSTFTRSGPTRSDSARTPATTGVSPSVTERSSQPGGKSISTAGSGTRSGSRSPNGCPSNTRTTPWRWAPTRARGFSRSPRTRSGFRSSAPLNT